MLLTVEDFCVIYNVTSMNLYATIKDARRSSRWVVRKDNTIYIDDVAYFKYDKIYRKAYTYATTKLYWVLVDELGFNCSRLSEILSSRSHKYTSKSSWLVFLSDDMWAENMQVRVLPKYTMVEDFVRLGSRLAYETIKATKNKLVV